MRFHSDNKAGILAKACLIISSCTALAACGALGGASPATSAMASPLQANGPQADYPVVIGAPYAVGDTQYTPADVLNYDEVGYLAVGTGEGITGGHHTLPYPSYVEVTSLETGKTILVRLERRGPMDSTHLLSLSPAAMSQLGGAQDTPIRVRRVNPPEEQRALLRSGEAAPMRMDTPAGLVEVLRRRLPAEGSASLRTLAEAPLSANSVNEELAELAPVNPAASPAPELPELPPVEVAEAAATPVPEQHASGSNDQFETDSFDEAFAHVDDGSESSEPDETLPPASVQPALTEGFVVQAAAFSTMARAQNVANAIGGRITQSGRFYRVRTGPFATRAQAEASLANVRAAGYTDARIYTAE